MLLGDYVGYGADPDWTVTTVMDLVDNGAIAVRGNHDNAVGDAGEQLNVEAQVAIEWTRGELGAAERRFLAELPLTPRGGRSPLCPCRRQPPGELDLRHRHRRTRRAASPPARCRCRSAAISIGRRSIRCRSTGKMTAFTPTAGVAIQLLPGRRWLAVLGSVGQPRDGNPAASYADARHRARLRLTWCRAPYDVEAAAARIREKGLPPRLADRLLVGR